MAVGEAHTQPLALCAAPVGSGHVRCRPGFIDKDEALGLQIDLAIEPVVALLQDIGTVLFNGVASLFFRVMP
jgi:hypothetical protein